MLDIVEFPVANVIVDRPNRQRGEVKTADLKPSILRNGVLHPILITREGKLIAGERRLQSCKELGLDLIPARFFDTLSGEEQQIIELEENIKRQDLPWQDLVRSVARIHSIFLLRDSDWQLQQTAEEICVSPSLISKYVRIAKHLHEERIFKAVTYNEAYNALLRRDERAAGLELATLISDAPFGEAAPQEDALGTVALVGDLEVIGAVAEDRFTAPGEALIVPGASPLTAGASMLRPPARLPAAPVRPASEASVILQEDFRHWVAKYRGD